MEANSQLNTKEWTIGRLLSWTTDYLHRSGIEEARLSTEVLLAHALECQRIDLYARFDQVPGNGTMVRFRDWVRRAAKHEPIAYLVEQKEFFSLPFRVTRDVLIPRPETETLVECVIDHCNKLGITEPRILDLGTGSGCIAVALLTQLKSAGVVASDISPAALAVARCNAERHAVDDRLVLMEVDGTAVSNECVPRGGFDVLVSNPPYVAVDDMEKLAGMVRDYEPRLALTDGDDGLSFYQGIARDAPRLVAVDGRVFVEIDDGKSSAVIAAMEASGSLKHHQTFRDRVSGAERVLVFSRRCDD